MQSVVLGSLSLLVALSPIALLAVGLQLASWRQRVRLAEITRQIAATDAVHAALGAVVSPVVRRTVWGGWRLAVPVPLDRPDVVTQVLDAASVAFSEAERASPRFQIVLTPQERPVPRQAPALIPAARGGSVSWT